MADVERWITIHPKGNKEIEGQPIPVKEGQSKGEAVKSFVNKHKSEVKELNKKSIDELKKEITQGSNNEFKAKSPDSEERNNFVNKMSSPVSVNSSDSDIQNNSLIIKETNPTAFREGLKKAKEGVDKKHSWRVDIHNESEYANDKLFMSEGGSCIAVQPNGNIISLCKPDYDKSVRGSDLLEYAIKNGGDRLDAFSGLYGFYIKNGFEPISWIPFDKNYAPKGWEEAKAKEEPVIFWKHTGKSFTINYDDFIKSTNPSLSYEDAMEKRDRSIKYGK